MGDIIVGFVLMAADLPSERHALEQVLEKVSKRGFAR
jgi:hypothetical protein